MISHRPAMSIDRNFIVKSWLASWRDSNTAGMISVDTWFEVMTPQVNARLTWPGVQTIVAFETTNPDITSNAYGFLVIDYDDSPKTVFYLFVKAPYRRSGIARGLRGGPIELILRPDPAAALATHDIFDAWDGELVYKDVTVAGSRR